MTYLSQIYERIKYYAIFALLVIMCFVLRVPDINSLIREEDNLYRNEE